jgi:hypothetical protein
MVTVLGGHVHPAGGKVHTQRPLRIDRWRSLTGRRRWSGRPGDMDQALADDGTIVLRAGSHPDTISVRYADFVRLVGAVEAECAVDD